MWMMGQILQPAFNISHHEDFIVLKMTSGDSHFKVPAQSETHQEWINTSILGLIMLHFRFKDSGESFQNKNSKNEGILIGDSFIQRLKMNT